MERLRRHITITMDVDPTADSPLLSCKVHPKTCGITEEDVKAMLNTSYGFQHYCIQERTTGLLVSGSRSIEDWALVDNILYSKVFEDTASKDVPVTMILNSTPGVTFLATDFAKQHKLQIEHITPDWDHIGSLAGGVCALAMIDALKKYYYKSILLIWDECSTEVPYFFQPALESGINLYIYSTKRNTWLSTDDLAPTIADFEERIDRCKIIYRDLAKNN